MRRPITTWRGPAHGAELNRATQEEGLALCAKAVELTTNNSLFDNTLGVALYRNDEYKEAVGVLEKSLAVRHGQADAFDLVFLAMRHQRLGHSAAAKNAFNRAETWRQERKGQLAAARAAELAAFQAEAEAVLAEPAGSQCRRGDSDK